MRLRLQSSSRARVALLAAIITAAASWYALLTEGWWVGASYDVTHRLAGPRDTAEAPVLLVYLDLESHLRERQDPAQLWDRRLHARLLRRLADAGARLVVFDILFTTPSPDVEADAEFRAALAAGPPVVLAAETALSSSTGAGGPVVRSHRVNLPEASLLAAAAGWGLAEAAVDTDFVARRLFPGLPGLDAPSLGLAVTRLLGRAEAAPLDAWIRYAGPPLSLPHVNYSQALRPEETADARFRGRIVVVGARPMAGMFGERRDELRSPFRTWRDPDRFMPAAEVHATEIWNRLEGAWLRRLPPGAEALLLAAAAWGLAWGLFRLRPPAAGGLALAAAGATGFAAWLAFRLGGWFPWLLVAGGQVPALLLGSVLVQSVEWYREKRRFEAAERAAAAKIREQAALLDKASDAILVRGLDGAVRYANPAAQRFHGGPPARLEAVDVAALREAEAAVLAAGEWLGELRLKDGEGRPRTLTSRWTLIRDDAGRPASILILNTDVTERREIEAQMQRVQRLEGIGALAGGLVHDLNNALAPVVMGLDLLRQRTADPETGRVLGLMETSTQRGVAMVRQVLHFARGQDAERRPLDPGAVLRELGALVRDTFPAGIRAAVLAPPDLWPIHASPVQLHQILLNLCVNARDAMPDGGELTLAADNVELAAEEGAQCRPPLPPGQYVMLLVSDTGQGITPEVQARLFEPFFTTKPPGIGTGLGLSTTLQLVQQHGGGLRLQSVPGEGTAFEIFLPSTRTVGVLTEAPAADAPAGRGELVAVAEEEAAFRATLGEVLAAHGYRVGLAGPGRPLPEETALVIAGGRPGPWLLELRARRPELPLILTGGDVLAGGGPAAPPPLVLLPRPFRVETLLTRVRGLLDRGTIGPEGADRVSPGQRPGTTMPTNLKP